MRPLQDRIYDCRLTLERILYALEVGDLKFDGDIRVANFKGKSVTIFVDNGVIIQQFFSDYIEDFIEFGEAVADIALDCHSGEFWVFDTSLPKYKERYGKHMTVLQEHKHKGYVKIHIDYEGFRNG